MVQTHEVLAGSKRTMLAGARVLGRANPQTQIEVTLKIRRMKELPELTGRPSKAMTREDLATYGASQENIDRVTSVLGKFGLTVVRVHPAARSIRLAGTVSSMENAFQVKLFNYAHENGNYRGRVGALQIPIELKGIVQGVFGLDNRRVAHRSRQPVRGTSDAKSFAAVPASWYTPSKLAAHYDFPTGQGDKQSVGILEFGGGFFEQDLEKFCKLTGGQVPTVKPISTDGTPTAAKDGAQGEVMLDVEIVAGCCPKSTIVVYFADWSEQGWITALDAATQDKENDPGVLSASWGFAEDADIWTQQAMTQVNESMKDAAYLGITVCIASGDDGSSDAINDGHAHVNFPSSSPYALSVGGTTIVSHTGTEGDIAWKEGDGLRADNGGSTGGGASAVFPRPTWQSTVKIESVNPGAIVGRVLPDVAANADWTASPYLLVVGGKAQPNGGTSAATPLWASLVTLINEQRGPGNRIGYLTPVLYEAEAGAKAGNTVGSEGCTDVLSGNNTTDAIGGYSAGPGYDAVSGWGTPNGQKLMASLPLTASAAAH
jgi:kumamolisin